MNMNAYKNIGGYISKIQVESYFNRNTVSVEKRWYMYWCVQEELKKNMSLNQCKQRSFVKNFETYIEYARVAPCRI
jgi:hypothetical protein